MRTYLALPAALVLIPVISLLPGCTRKQSPKTLPTPDSLPPSAQTAHVTVKLTTARDTSLTAGDSTHSFGIRDTVHASVRTDGAKAGSTLTGIWYYLKDSSTVAQNRAALQDGSNATHFDLVNNRPWLQGVYKLVVYLDSLPKDSVRFWISDKR